jgi:hypothetical protein
MGLCDDISPGCPSIAARSHFARLFQAGISLISLALEYTLKAISAAASHTEKNWVKFREAVRGWHYLSESE